jgi:hypothetical protein
MSGGVPLVDDACIAVGAADTRGDLPLAERWDGSIRSPPGRC